MAYRCFRRLPMKSRIRSKHAARHMAHHSMTPVPDQIDALRPGRDDAGRATGTLSLRTLGASRNDELPADRAARLALVRRLRAAVKHRNHASVAIGLGEIITVVPIALSLIVGLIFLKSVLFIVLAVVLAAVLLHRWFWAKIAERVLRPFVSRTAVSEGWCGSCAYSLRGLPADESGLLHCPECGAAWLSSRITKNPDEHSPAMAHLHQYGWFHRFLSSKYADALSRPIPDDRGRIVTVLDPQLRLLESRLRQSLPRQHKRAWRRAMNRPTRAYRWCFKFGAVVCVFAILNILNVLTSFSVHSTAPRQGNTSISNMMVWAYVGIVFIFMPIMVTIYRVGMRRSLPAQARAVLKIGMCPTCAKTIMDLPPEPDGCVICPGCRSAWRRAPDRISPAPPRGSAEPVASRSAPQA